MGGTAETTTSISFPDGPRRAVGRTPRHGGGGRVRPDTPPPTPPFTDLQKNPVSKWYGVGGDGPAVDGGSDGVEELDGEGVGAS